MGFAETFKALSDPIRRDILTLLKNGRLSFSPEAEGILSVFCMGADAHGVTLKNLYYPLENGTLTAGFPLGVSNHFTGNAASVSVADGSLLLLWDRKNGLPCGYASGESPLTKA